MASVDELFKRPSLPNSISKRKRAEPRNYNEIFKAQKTTVNGDVKGQQHASVEEDTTDQNEYDEDAEAGPQLPPDDDDIEAGPQPVDEAEDEEGGRFFGAGANNQILDYMESQDGQIAEPEKIDNSWLRRTALGFEKKISKNRELRSKFEDDPLKFMESEGDLDAEIKTLSTLSEHTGLYPEFVKLGSVDSLVQLLLHENTDIAINAISILAELTDEDANATQDQWDALVSAILDADVIELLLGVLDGLDDTNPSDREGIAQALSLFENLCGNASTLNTILEADKDDNFLTYLLKLMQKHEDPLPQNTQAAAELLSIIAAQSSPDSTDATALGRGKLVSLNAPDAMLQLLARYRKVDPPRGSDAEEYATNLFSTLDCLVDAPAGKRTLLDAEGVELALIMLRGGEKFARSHALRLLDHATAGSGEESVSVCERLVEGAGLKPLFKIFMAADMKKDREGVEHTLSLLSSLLRCLPGDSAPRIRTLAKFSEKGCEKIVRLVVLRRQLEGALQSVDDEIEAERKVTEDEDERAELEGEWLVRRLEGGMFSLQMVDVCLAWLVAEDDGAKEKVHDLLGDFAAVKATLTEQLKGLDEEGSEDEKRTSDILSTLIEFLE